MSEVPVGIVRPIENDPEIATLRDIGFRPPDAWSIGAVVNSMFDLRVLAESMFRGGLAPDGINSGREMAALLMRAADLNITPAQAATGLYHTGRGRFGMTVDLALALVLRSGLLESFERGIDKSDMSNPFGWCRLRRHGLDYLHEVKFSWGDATRAGLTHKDNWKMYPDRMLEARAVGLALSDLFADVLCGMEPGSEPFDDGTHAAETVSRIIAEQQQQQQQQQEKSE